MTQANTRSNKVVWKSKPAYLTVQAAPRQRVEPSPAKGIYGMESANLYARIPILIPM